MSGKDKDNAMNKLKHFFRKGKGTGIIQEQSEFSLSEIECQIQPETPVAQRCKALKEISESVRKTTLADAEIKKLWDLTKDLILPNKPAEQRQTALNFYCHLIQGQYESLSIMRAHFFRVIQNHEIPEDIAHRLELLKTLTDSGKNITDFEEIIGGFMLGWKSTILSAGLTEPYLEIIVNMIKFNAAYLDKVIIVGIVQHVCYLSHNMDDSKTVLQCLNVLDATIRYTVFPTETLLNCILALCQTVNSEIYYQISWKIMKNLLCTNLGHAALVFMCNILDDSAMYANETVLRGAVFHINMGLWGTSGLPMLRCPTSAVLQSFLHALGSRRRIVTFEVILSIQRLIKTSGKDLSEPTWDVICDILFTISENIAYYEKSNLLPKDRSIEKSFHETLNIIETYMHRNEIAANLEKMYSLIESVSSERPEQSIFQLMNHLTLKISATESNWLQALSSFVERFFKMSNVNVRMRTIQILNEVMINNRASYEEEILDRVVLQHFHNIYLEQDSAIQTAVAKMLLDFACHSETKTCLDLLEIIKKILHRPFELIDTNKSHWQNIVTIVDGLIEIFLVKLYRYPANHAVKIFDMIIAYLEKLNTVPQLLESSSIVRLNIYNWLMSVRANCTFHIGYPDYQNNGAVRFGHYISTDQLQTIMPEAATTFTFISMRKPFKKIVDCLQFERDWFIVQLVLKTLPNMLQNKAIFVGLEMDMLANTLMRTYSKRNVHELFVPANARPSSSEFEEIILTAIAALVPYHSVLIPHMQKELIETLRSGLSSRTPRLCVYALTVLLIEIPDIMLRNVPEVLLEMSKMSTTVNVAVPVLEFLSTLNRMPNSRFANFVVVQYMYVFAISLPYTNPYKYNHYTVSLAHHVIAGWFLKCRMPLRRNFVNYLIKGFETNVQMPFNETKKVDMVNINEDSTNRKRSSSLTEQGSRRQSRASLPQLQTQQQMLQQQLQNKPDDALKNFHMELAETGIDFLARYTFSPCSALPKRLPTAEFLLAGGQSLTWLIGHNLVTITTSGCNSIPTKTGLCDRCSALCRVPSPKKSETTTPSASATIPSPETLSTKTDSASYNKRYTKASLQHSGGQDSGSSDVTSSTSSSSAQPTDGRFVRQTSTDASRFNSSSMSLEAITRRGSNPDTPGSTNHPDPATKHESISNISRPVHSAAQPTPQQIVERERSKQTCACSCVGWAEICIRRPTGNMSWIMRNQNQVSFDNMSNEFPLNDLVNLFIPSLGGVFDTDLLSEISQLSECNPELLMERKVSASSQLSEAKSQESDDRHRVDRFGGGDEEPMVQNKLISSGPIAIPKSSQPLKESAGSFSDVEPEPDENLDNPDIEYEDDESRSRNPVRRVNSSPEMSSNWRNPLLNQKGPLPTVGIGAPGSSGITQSGDDDKPLTPEIEQQQKKKGFCKDMRVSCEAIPEEIPGSTPPSNPNSVKDNTPLVAKMTQSVANTNGNQVEVTAKPAPLVPSASFPTETTSTAVTTITTSTTTTTTSSGSVTVMSPQGQTAVPKKQHSADDAISPTTSTTKTTAPTATESNPSSPMQLQLQSGQTAVSTKLKIPMDVQKVTTKPPQSPAPLSPRMLAKNEGNKIPSFVPSIMGANGIESIGGSGNANGNNDQIRGRSKTISVVRGADSRENLKWTSFKGTRSGLSPSSILLQLYNAGANKSIEPPIHIGPTNAKAVALLDLIPPYETHRIGVLYVGAGQANNEVEILKNRHGSMRYALFLRKLGTLVALKDAKENNLFVNMERNGRDGDYTYIWQDEIIHVLFHIATMMPNKEQDPFCNEKKKHIGNDFVTIVYNESGEDYNLNTIKGQFKYACVIVEPMEFNSNRIFVRTKDEVVAKYVGHSDPEIVSDSSAPLFARQLALHANLASLVAKSLRTKNQSPYASNWLERLRKIKHLRAKILKEHAPTTTADLTNTTNSSSNSSISSINSNSSNNSSSLLKLDFTTYTQ